MLRHAANGQWSKAGSVLRAVGLTSLLLAVGLLALTASSGHLSAWAGVAVPWPPAATLTTPTYASSYVTQSPTTIGITSPSTEIFPTPVLGCWLSVSPQRVTITAGEAATYQIYVTVGGGFSDSLTYFVTGLPLGTVPLLGENPDLPTNGYGTTLTIQTYPSTQPGAYSILITAAGGPHGVAFTCQEEAHLVIGAPPLLPDLIVKNMMWTPSTPYVGETYVHFDVVISNRGQESANLANMRLTLYKNSLNTVFGYFEFGSTAVAFLGPGQDMLIRAITEQDSHLTEAAGTFTVIAYVDSKNTIQESDDTNNQFSEQITISLIPIWDMTVTPLVIEANVNRPVYTNQAAFYSITITGTDPDYDFLIQYDVVMSHPIGVSPPPYTWSENPDDPSNGYGTTLTVYFDNTTPTGVYHIFVEARNIVKGIQKGPPKGRDVELDLVYVYVKGWPESRTVSPGQQAWYCLFTVPGGLDLGLTNPSGTTYIFDPNPTPSTILKWCLDLSTVSILTVSTSSSLTPGDYPLTVLASDSSRNFLAGSQLLLLVRSNPTADVAPDTVFTYSPSSSIRQGDTVSFVAYVMNYGNWYAANFIVECYLDGVSITSRTVTYLAGGNHPAGIGDPSEYFEIPWTATAGHHTIQWKVDTTNAVSESNEANNEASYSFDVSTSPSPLDAPQASAPAESLFQLGLASTAQTNSTLWVWVASATPIRLNEVIRLGGVMWPSTNTTEIELVYRRPDGSELRNRVEVSSQGEFMDALRPDMRGTWSIAVSGLEKTYEANFQVLEAQPPQSTPGSQQNFNTVMILAGAVAVIVVSALLLKELKRQSKATLASG